jgi:hypothetical protein
MLLSNRNLTILARGIAVLALLSSALYAQTPLQITTASPLPSGTVGSAYAVGLQAQGGNQPYSWSATGQLPPGLALLSSGVISGTPTTTGTYSFTVVIRDSSGVSASKQLSLTVGGTGGSTVSITTRTLPAGVVGQPYSQQISATGGTGTYTFTATGLPAGLTLSSSGLLSGTPTVPGNFTLSVQAKDTGNGSATASLTLAIQAAPLSITTSSPLFTGTVGTPYSQPFSAIGGVLPYTWSISSGNTDGLTLDAATGNLAGTPQSAGTFNFTVQVADKNGSVASGSYSLVVNTPALSILLGAPLQPGNVGVAYSQKLPVQATGGTPPYTWSITAGLPPGLSFDPSTLILSGTPTAAGTFNMTVQVSDAGGLTTTRTLALAIGSAGLSITTARQLPDAVINVPYSQSLAATGGQPPYRWSANGLPAGLTINSATGQISGTPTAAGPFGIAITVTDNALANASDRFTMNVTLPATPPVTLSPLPSTLSPAQQYTVQVSIGSAYPAAITGVATLIFAPDTGPADRTIQFASGGTTATFSIPLGATAADAPLTIQTGTVSGTITVSVQLLAGGIDITPSPAPSTSGQVPRAAPVIRSVQVSRSGTTLSLAITGYSTAREITQAVFAFGAASGQSLQQSASSITVDVTSLFGNWFVDPANSQFGSIFVFTQPFTIQGDVNSVIPTSVTLTNRVGSTTFPIAP